VQIYVKNTSKYARTCWGSLCAPPDPIAAMGGLLIRGETYFKGNGRGKQEERGQKGRGDLPKVKMSRIKHCPHDTKHRAT